MYAWEPVNIKQVVQLRKVCREIVTAVPTVHYAGYTIRLLSLHPATTGPEVTIRAHRHTFYEGIIFLHGSARELCGTRQQLPPGTLQLHAPGVLHGWHARGQTVYRLGCWFSVTPALVIPPPDGWPRPARLLQDVQSLLAEAHESRDGRDDRLHARMLLLLSHFLALGRLTPPRMPARQQVASLVSLARQYISDNLAAPLTLADIAEQVGVSVPTLTRQIRAETGLSVMEYVLAQRMAQAARLLRESRMNVAEIGVSVGIADSSYFCRRFKQCYGMTPRRYRLQPAPLAV